MQISFTVLGVPQPKGSTRAFVHNGRAVTTNANAKTKPWQKQVAAAASVAFAMRAPTEKAVLLRLEFRMPRPKTVKRALPTVKPDIDKLERTILDALTGIAYVDDAQVCTVTKRKRYVEFNQQPHVLICFEEVDE